MKLSTTTGDFSLYTTDHIEAIDYMHQTGFRYMDYNFGDLDFQNRSGAFSEKWKDYAHRVTEHAASLGMRFVQAHAPMGKPLADEQIVLDTIRCVESCGVMGIPNLVVHSGYLPDISKEECFALNKKFYDRLLAVAENYGVNILVENFNKMNKPNIFWIDNAADLRTMIDIVDHPLFHAVWDVGHANLQEMPQHEELRLLGSHVRALHIQDNMGDRDSHLLPLTGTLNLDSVMHGLQEIGYDGYFSFEVGRFFTLADKRRPFPEDTRLADPPLAARIAMERLMYQIGKSTLEAYGCFEE